MLDAIRARILYTLPNGQEQKRKHVRRETGSSPGIANEDFTRIAVANATRQHRNYLIAVSVWLEGPFDVHANIVGLLL